MDVNDVISDGSFIVSSEQMCTVPGATEQQPQEQEKQSSCHNIPQSRSQSHSHHEAQSSLLSAAPSPSISHIFTDLAATPTRNTAAAAAAAVNTS
jgi:hypothetical protein